MLNGFIKLCTLCYNKRKDNKRKVKMEQDMANTKPAINKDKSNDEKRWKIATVIASVVAVCGIGFGVYGMIYANSIKSTVATKDAEISNLTDQLDSLNAKIDELESNGNTQQNSSSQETQTDGEQDKSIVEADNESLTPGIENGMFVFKNSAGVIIMQDSEIKNVSFIIACDGNNTGKCTAKTSDGKSVWFVFDLDSKEIKSGYSSVDYGF